jgi:uncharacterized protein YijF (DUF1287 family)
MEVPRPSAYTQPCIVHAITPSSLYVVLAVTVAAGVVQAPRPPRGGTPHVDALVAAAMEQTRHQVMYDGSYRVIPYPNGDVPANIGVCTDVIIRAYRAVGIDLQRLVHEDMRSAFSSYPNLWGLKRPDRNIDHRRVPNLQTFFTRRNAALPRSRNAADYQAGDLVTWMLPGNLPHIGIVSSTRASSGRLMLVHNIGRGPQLEDVLFAYDVTGHYRY